MQMKASDMPYDVKQQLLRQIEDQVGSSQYYELVNKVGEDGLIDLAIQKMEEMSASAPVKRERTRKQKVWLAIKILLGVLILLVWIAASPDSFGEVWKGITPLLLIMVGYVVVVWIWGALKEWWDENMTFHIRR